MQPHRFSQPAMPLVSTSDQTELKQTTSPCASALSAIHRSNAAVFSHLPTNDASVGMSFIHSFLTEQRATAHERATLAESGNSPSALQPAAQTTAGLEATQRASDRALSDDIDELEDVDDASEESEWSEHIDVDIGWWHRQRRRRHRRNPTNNDSVSSTQARRDFTTGHSDDTNDPLASPDATLTRTEADSGMPRATEATETDSYHCCRRSVRQLRRSLARRRMLREKRLNDLRAERDRRRASVRRSQRFLRRNGPDVIRGDESIPTNTEIMAASPLRANNSSPFCTDASTLSMDDSLGERRERLKRRLIRTVDYLLSTGIQVPVSCRPVGGYEGPDCEGSTYPSFYTAEPSSTQSATQVSWSGPHFDWLSTYHPVPTPYVPQLGDRVVYVRRGHEEYLKFAWKDGTIPRPDHPHFSSTCVVPRSTVPLSAMDITALPWQVWSQMPHYVCGTVEAITYSIVRVCPNAHSNSRGRSRCHRSKFTRSKQPTSSRSTSRVRSFAKRRSIHRSSHFANGSADSVVAHGQEDAVTAPDVDGMDSFVRLVTLSIGLDHEQTYSTLGQVASTKPAVEPPAHVHVTYHDVDGVLDFVILRHLFDAAMQRTWNTGDRFICPVGTVWWCGCVLRPFVADRSTVPTDGEPVPCCSRATQHCVIQPDPWLTMLVRWLETSESDVVNGVDAVISLTDMPDNVDRLNPWDLHPWTHPDAFSNTTTDDSFSLSGAIVHVSPVRVRMLYGTSDSTESSSRLTSITQTYLPNSSLQSRDDVRLIQCFEQIMRLPISELFNTPVDLATYPDYLFVNPYPVDLSLIRARLVHGFYRQSDAIRGDVQQLLDNTVRYNEPTSLIVRHARLVHRLCVRCLDDASQMPGDVQREYECLMGEVNQTSNSTISTVTRRGHVSRSSAESSLSNAELPPISQSDCPATTDSVVITESDHPACHSDTRRPTSSGLSFSYQSQRRMRRKSEHLAAFIFPKMHEICLECVHLDGEQWAVECLNHLKCVMTNRRSMFFREPIDTDAYPDYLDFVTSPMDLTTIQQRLRATLDLGGSHRSRLRSASQHFYRCPHECLDDLRRIVSNSQSYNTDSDTVIFDDTLWLEQWIVSVFVPYIRTLLERSGMSANRLRPPNSPSPNTRTRLQSTRTRIRQSNLACRKLALRKIRKKMLLPKPNRDKSAETAALNCSSQHSTSESTDPRSYALHRTSSGRIVRPPKRDIHVVELLWDSDMSDLDSDHPVFMMSAPQPMVIDDQNSCSLDSSSVEVYNTGGRGFSRPTVPSTSSPQLRRSKRLRR